uniref:Reverse transcriptase domain-containing protein n=1 Tax=Globodera rostochiensis TaxID=31243 RepID=A0A914HRH5_GLORO
MEANLTTHEILKIAEETKKIAKETHQILVLTQHTVNETFEKVNGTYWLVKATLQKGKETIRKLDEMKPIIEETHKDVSGLVKQDEDRSKCDAEEKCKRCGGRYTCVKTSESSNPVMDGTARDEENFQISAIDRQFWVGKNSVRVHDIEKAHQDLVRLEDGANRAIRHVHRQTVANYQAINRVSGDVNTNLATLEAQIASLCDRIIALEEVRHGSDFGDEDGEAANHNISLNPAGNVNNRSLIVVEPFADENPVELGEINTLTNVAGKKQLRERLVEEFLDRLKPNISFLVRVAGLAKEKDLDLVKAQAEELEALLATQKGEGHSEAAEAAGDNLHQERAETDSGLEATSHHRTTEDGAVGLFATSANALATCLTIVEIAEDGMKDTTRPLTPYSLFLLRQLQGYAIPSIDLQNTRSKRRVSVREGMVTASQLASELSYLNWNISKALSFSLQHAVRSICEYLEENRRWAISALLIDPTGFARIAFGNSNLHAKRGAVQPETRALPQVVIRQWETASDGTEYTPIRPIGHAGSNPLRTFRHRLSGRMRRPEPAASRASAPIDTGSSLTVASRSLSGAFNCKVVPINETAISASGHLIKFKEKAELSKETSWKCGVITEDNIYQMLFMPFGLKNATAAFSRAMAVVLCGLEDCALSYVDDILVYTKQGTFRDHLVSIKIVHIAGKQNSLADALSRAAEDVPTHEVQHLPEMEDIVEFPICLSLTMDSRLSLSPFVNTLTLRHEDGNSYQIDLAKEQKEDPEAAAYIQFLANGEIPNEFSECEKDTFAAEASNLCLLRHNPTPAYKAEMQLAPVNTLFARVGDPVAFTDDTEFKQRLVTSLRKAWHCAAEINEKEHIRMKAQYDKRVHINQLKRCFELTGPACTLPNLPQEDRANLEEIGAEELVNQPGFSHTEKTDKQNTEGGPIEPNEATAESVPEVSAEGLLFQRHQAISHQRFRPPFVGRAHLAAQQNGRLRSPSISHCCTSQT